MKNVNYSLLYEAIFKQITLPDNAMVIDLGCQNASFLTELQRFFPGKIEHALGVDISDNEFKTIPYQEPIILKVINCSHKLEFNDNTFDFVFTKDMFECVADKNFLVSEIHRILKPGGTVISVNCDWDSIVYNGEDKDLITNVIHSYATTKQPWMENIDSWVGRRMFGFFNRSTLFKSNISVFNMVETEYKKGTYGYELSIDIGWLYKENTGVISKEIYNDFINNLKLAQKDGYYIFSKPYYIYQGIKIK